MLVFPSKPMFAGYYNYKINKFFGADDPARQEKINRVLELRRALENN